MQAATKTCRHHEHPEFVLDYDPAIVIEPDVEWLLEFLERSVCSGTRYRNQETISIGWTDTLIEQTDSNHLRLLEPDWTGKLPIEYIPSVTRALADLRRQKDVAESLGLGEHLSFPTIRQSAIVCNQLGARDCGVLDRARTEGQDSGWFFGCNDPVHDHNDVRVLKRISLYEIGCRMPEVVQFCALPPGSNVLLGGAKKIVVCLDGDDVEIRKGSYLERLLHQAWIP